MQQAASSISAGKDTYNTIAAVVALLAGVDPVIELAVAAGDVLVNIVASQGTAAVSAAAADTTLQANVRCAIYTAISAVGYVDATNYSAVLANLSTVSYSNALIVGAIHDFVAALGLNGVQQLQRQGPFYQGDCSACGATDKALRALGATSFVQGSAYSGLPLGSTARTREAWIRLETNSDGGYICSYGTPGGGGTHNSIDVCSVDVGSVSFTAYFSDVSWSTSAFADHAWHHLAIVTGGSSIIAYVDGVSLGTKALPAGALATTSAPLYLGGRSYVPGTGPYFVGDMNEFALYASALSASRIAAHAGAPTLVAYRAAVQADSPVLYWGLDVGPGQTVADLTAHGYNATVAPAGSATQIGGNLP